MCSLLVQSIKSYLATSSNLLWVPFQFYKWLVVVPVFLVSTLLVCVLIILLSTFSLQNLSASIGAFWGRLNALFMLMRIEVESDEKVAPGQSYVIVSNHQSLVDILTLYGYSGMNIRWVMKKELRAIPIFGLACERMGQIIVDRSNTKAAVESINKARSKIRDGVSIVFFAEGTRSREGEVKQFRKGAFRLAQKLGIPVLPVSIHGAGKILPSDTLDWAPGDVKVMLHEPIPTKDLGLEDVDALGEQTRQVIGKVLAES
ncbi:MAG: 1-acyl-sn-glycerol-3-phosphate acyltransferase [Gammaproteobacteria bacterium]|jgi:1-acyl-sn-glycerol-3-phosphate acyltransferase|nr:1-acyl-sn-glycerol-3-phosphate acyltransferase [Gammaproteobacteria bacterium]|tara:strand:+ start:31 stop:807 length:777 start_codon:yes stop_codon:yes gene_type:complete